MSSRVKMTPQTCRICQKSNFDSAEPLFNYSVRTYVHARCALEKWGTSFLDKLDRDQLGNLPWIVLSDYGLLDEVRSRLKRRTYGAGRESHRE